MRHTLKLTALFLFALSFNCIAQSKAQKKDVEFDYPDDIKEEDKQNFAKQIKKGNILYGINCAKCHTIKENGKEIIPDFSLPQLLDYEIRVSYPEHQDPMRDVNITKEELDAVVLFLQYKKRNAVVEKQ